MFRGSKMATVSAALYALAIPHVVQAETLRPIDVPAQPLPSALTELADETGLTVMAPREILEGKESRTVSGTMTPQAALSQMLKETGLMVQVQNNTGAIVSQDALKDSFDLGTLILRGERVERDIFNTASSVEAFDGETIEANPQDNDVESLFENVPNITTGTGNTAAHIRGVNSAGEISGGALGTIAGSLPRATITVDGRNLSPNETIYGTTSIFDADAVEVFRGPQTTSQGANAIAGAINIRTRDPVFEREAAIRLEGASDNGRVASLMFNTPLSDSLATRFVIDFEEQDLYFSYPAGTPVFEEVEKQRQLATRLKFLLEPVNIPQLSTQLTFSYSEYSGPQNQSLSLPLSSLVSFGGGAPPAFIGDTYAVIHDLEYDLGNGFVIRNQFQYTVDRSLRTNGPTAPALDFRQKIIDQSNETILEYTSASGAFSGILGLYFRDTEEDGTFTTAVLSGDRQGYGVFGEFTQDIGNGFDVTAGLRYQANDQRRLALFGPITALDFDRGFDAWLPSLTLGYEPSENTRFAAKISQGYNPGGAAVILTSFTLDPYQYREETVTSVELSMRHRSDDGRLFIAANLFYNDYDDYQLFVDLQVPPTGLVGSTQAGRVFNVDDVVTYGLEVTAQYEMTDDLTIFGSLGLLETDVGNLGPTIANFIGSTSNNGNNLPLAPNTTFNLGADFQVTDRLSLGGRMTYTSSYFSSIDNTSTLEVGDYFIFDARAAYQVSDQAEIYGYVNNVFDRRAATTLFTDNSNPAIPLANRAIIGGSVTVPREIGIGIRAAF